MKQKRLIMKNLVLYAVTIFLITICSSHARIRFFPNEPDEYEKFIFSDPSLAFAHRYLMSQETGRPLFSNASRNVINQDTLFIYCYTKNFLTGYYMLFDTLPKFKTVEIRYCDFPPKDAERFSVYHILQYDMNVDASTSVDLRIYFNDVKTDLPVEEFINMENLQKLSLNAQRNVKMHFTDYRKFKQLTDLSLSRVTFTTPIPEHIKLEKLYVSNNTLFDFGKFNCEQVEFLTLEGLEQAYNMVNNWPKSCRQVKNLHLLYMDEEALKAISEKIFTWGFKIQTLNVTNCVIKNIKRIGFVHYEYNQNLIHLDLRYNNLVDDAFLQGFPLHKLISLDLSHNKLTGQFILDFALNSVSNNLKELKLDHNLMRGVFNSTWIEKSYSKFKSLERLSLNGNELDPKCLQNVSFPKLKHLSMTLDPAVSTIQPTTNDDESYVFNLEDLPTTGASNLEVDFRGRQIHEMIPHINLNSTAKANYTKLTLINVDHLDCDCKNDELLQAFKNYPQFISLPNAMCDNGPKFVEVPFELLYCTKRNLRGCIRRRSKNEFSKSYSYLDCSNQKNYHRCSNMTRGCFLNSNLGALPGLRGVNVSDTGIHLLHGAAIPDALEWIDIRNNGLTLLNSTDVGRLFGAPNRRLWLSGNPFICDCNNRALIETMQTNHKQIMDYDNVTCNGTSAGTPVKLVKMVSLCGIGPEIYVPVIVVVVLLILGVCWLIWRYWYDLRAWLYARGCCRSCMKNDDNTGRRIQRL